MFTALTPEMVLRAYRQGVFPMAEGANEGDVFWVCPEMRGQLSIERLHVPKRLKKTVCQGKLSGGPYDIRINHAFKDVMEACAAQTVMRKETWINPSIIHVFCMLHDMGHAHSVECYVDGKLVGGLYGLSIGSAFFGESMFSAMRDASKVCMVHLAARLFHARYDILDTQFTNDHLEQFGVYEIPHAAYLEKLIPALRKDRRFIFDEADERFLVHQYFNRERSPQ